MTKFIKITPVNEKFEEIGEVILNCSEISVVYGKEGDEETKGRDVIYFNMKNENVYVILPSDLWENLEEILGELNCCDC